MLLSEVTTNITSLAVRGQTFVEFTKLCSSEYPRCCNVLNLVLNVHGCDPTAAVQDYCVGKVALLAQSSICIGMLVKSFEKLSEMVLTPGLRRYFPVWVKGDPCWMEGALQKI